MGAGAALLYCDGKGSCCIERTILRMTIVFPTPLEVGICSGAGGYFVFMWSSFTSETEILL